MPDPQNNSLYVTLQRSQTQPGRFVSTKIIYHQEGLSSGFLQADTINVALELVAAIPSTHRQSLARNHPQ